ncbi:hypothetical protein [Nocardiopsis sp. HUAS JQ3]|uniref:hypothetical protein n=1 Tax=Nocardiopsis sp. HUAS JQ3 TaxID=3061629 RepID=UPI0023A96CCD|nr:hypothetical protein [Nocardiopsis sp. HUAS JQ3]WDZ91189.1 hypothetical protein PV789_01010 [Nocardiopsis sp. HUAS JQ3]
MSTSVTPEPGASGPLPEFVEMSNRIERGEATSLDLHLWAGRLKAAPEDRPPLTVGEQAAAERALLAQKRKKEATEARALAALEGLLTETGETE